MKEEKGTQGRMTNLQGHLTSLIASSGYSVPYPLISLFGGLLRSKPHSGQRPLVYTSRQLPSTQKTQTYRPFLGVTSMLQLSVVELGDVADRPKAKLTLPVPLRLGERLHLAFVLRRVKGGRSEILEVYGEYRVTAVGFTVDYQHLIVEAVGMAPSWRAIKREPAKKRKLAPARSPRMPVK
jgi:hypothetical protein